MLKRLFCVLLVIAFGFTMGFAQTQTPTTQGTEFWVSFMRNGYRMTSSSDKLTLFASAKEACTVTVENPNTHWKRNFTVAAAGVASFNIPDDQGYNDQQGGTADKGLLVTADDTISLFFANETTNSYDASNVLPLQALGYEYMVQSYKSLGEQGSIHMYENRASFLIIATEDDTQVQITPTCETWDNHRANEPYMVPLHRGQCYHVLNKDPGSTEDGNGDFSGTRIESLDEKPIAVFNGNCITAVPDYVTAGYDHVFEQAMPIENWGNRFVVTSIYPHPNYGLLNDYVKITALYDHTIVKRDGVEMSNPSELMAGESRVFEMDLTNDPYTFLESDNPVAVYLYNHSHGPGDNANGDPSMVWISPVEQTIDEITFSTFPAEKVRKHYVNIVCYTEHAAELMLDGNHVAEIRPVQSNPDFSYVRKEVFGDRAAHNIRCPGGFVAYVYGFGSNEGYAYTVGSSAKILTNQLYVNDILSTELPDGYSVCENDATVGFRAEVNYEFHHMSWNFGDGTTGEGEMVSHEYTSDGDFEVTVEVYREVEGEMQLSGSMQTTIHVTPQISAEPDNIAICEGGYCMWHGERYSEPDTYHVLEPDPSTGCDILYTLNLTIDTGPENPDRTMVSCEPIYWGDVLCDETKDYYRTFTTDAGCEYDSVLHFQYFPPGDIAFEKDTCDYYVWLGKVFDELGYHEYDSVIVGEGGCESHLTLKLTLHESPPFNGIVGLTQVAVATSYWPGEYIYRLDDSTGLDVSTIVWELQENPAGPEQWELIPHGASCTVIAYSMGQRTLMVSSGEAMCDRKSELVINCTAYGVGENEIGELEVFPNPARDEVRVRGSEMKEVVIYDLMGQKLKTVPVHGASEVSVKVGDLPQALYLLEVRTMRGNKTRKVSVIR